MPLIDTIYIGQTFGSWTVIDKAANSTQHLLVRCSCGIEKICGIGNLIGGRTKSCSWCSKKRYRINDKVGMLRLVEFLGEVTGHKGGTLIRAWKCLCDCGSETVLSSHDLSRKKRLSQVPDRNPPNCGCMNSGSTHHNWNGCGLIGKTYWNHVVRSAKERNFCFEITIEEAWQQFVKQGGRCSLTNWPICFAPPSNPTGATASLDRINSLGNYTLDNIQWLHKDVNYMKNDYEQSRLIEVAHAIAANNPIPQGSSKC